MATLDAKTIAEAIITEMKASGHALWIDPETHAAQHDAIPMLVEFIEELKKERRERTERRDRINEKIAGSLILSAIMGLVTLLGAGVLSWAQSHFR